METKYWGPYSIDELQENVNVGRLLILDKLLRDKKINADDYKYYTKNFAVIAIAPTLFSKIWSKLKKNAEADYFVLVEQHSLKEDIEKGEKEK
jgi:hypothetical protein